MSDTPQASRWHIDRSISVADVVAIISSGVLVMTAYSALNTRLTVVEARQDQQQRQRTEDMTQIRGDIEYIRRTLETIAARDMARHSEKAAP